jgi:hypothetical protein
VGRVCGMHGAGAKRKKIFNQLKVDKRQSHNPGDNNVRLGFGSVLTSTFKVSPTFDLIERRRKKVNW